MSDPLITPAPVSTPALFFAAPASGQGKTTITAAVARYFSQQGLTVRVFKTGPDYLDPQILHAASDAPSVQLDLWMAGESYCKAQLYDAARQADLILIEGAMGLFDGEPSSADLAKTFGVPVAMVMDVKGMAQTAAAVFQGLANFRDDFAIAGFIANNCGSDRHRQLIEEALDGQYPLIAALKRDESISLPERHLGLVQTFEMQDEINALIDKGADWISQTGLANLPKPVVFYPEAQAAIPKHIDGLTIAVAKDAAFSFIYDVNISTLEAMGASIEFFSPLANDLVPDADALWLPGGYPELYAEQLAKNTATKASLQAFFKAGKPIVAECGGMLYCAEKLVNFDELDYAMAGILPGFAHFSGRRGCQGMQRLVTSEGEIRGHAHHRSQFECAFEPSDYARRQRHPAPGEPIYQSGSLVASYLHLFFPSNPELTAQLFKGECVLEGFEHVA
ncbi:MAG: cobyrinate a,c-diamide synthase [Cellvibrionales bacterium]|nr:cobyrinate a,c-diamide synthase [Cellvibrionales bacterium]